MATGENTMNGSYLNVIDQIYNASWTANKLSRFSLLQEAMQALLPHQPKAKTLKYIQVVGTSGKGSTTRFLEAGLNTVSSAGSLTSPHVFDYRERFSVAGQMPTRPQVTEIWEKKILAYMVAQAEAGQPALSFTELTILIALHVFTKAKVEWAVMEAALGGRYDQTQALQPQFSVLTNVGDDHRDFLGEHLWQRALDKGGIIQEGRQFFTSETALETVEILQNLCREQKTAYIDVSASEVAATKRALQKLLSPQALQQTLFATDIQYRNAALALKVIASIYPEADETRILTAFTRVRIIGRFQKIAPNIYIDIAHNPNKIVALADTLQAHFPKQKKIFVLGFSRGKNIADMLKPLLPQAQKIFVATEFYKSEDAATVKKALKAAVKRTSITFIEDPKQALRAAQEFLDLRRVQGAGEDTPLILTGSTYMIAAATNPDPYLEYINTLNDWRDPQQHR